MYKCNECDKEFEKRMAYIGHCSSHNRGDSYKSNRRKSQPTFFELTNKHVCKFCSKEFDTGIKLGGHVIRCKLNPTKVTKIAKHSVESKKKISQSVIKYLKNNPDKHPWKNSSKFKSNPCEKFKELLRSHSINFEPEYCPLEDRMFSIDIALVDKKIGIEINGNQHYDSSGKLKEYYQKRHDLITDAGWTLIEIHYKCL